MNPSATPRAQRGATLVVGLIMLTLITVMVTSAVTMSSTDLKMVGNVQWRDEAVAAANRAIEQVLSSPFTNAPTAQGINVDIDNDGNADYAVAVAAPTCISGTELPGMISEPSSILLGPAFSVATSSVFQTVWEIDATATQIGDAATGAAVRVRQGVRVLLPQTQFNLVCGP